MQFDQPGRMERAIELELILQDPTEIARRTVLLVESEIAAGRGLSLTEAVLLVIDGIKREIALMAGIGGEPI